MTKFIRKHQFERIQRRLLRLYGDRAPELAERLVMMIGRYGVGNNPRAVAERWNENDVVLITYADMVQAEGEAPLQTFRNFASKHLKSTIRCVHFLPFYPWTSDDGFSVKDYRRVKRSYGTWDDVEAVGEDFSLMFDLVLNHCSAHSEWFRDFVTGIAPARYYFLPMDPETDLSAVTRPRPWPLLTKTMTREGEAWVWTTFSEDQVDLNWQNPDVLFEFLDILFLYISKGSRILRLDAVAFLWKEIGTNCLHRPETHEVVKLFRDVLEIVAPEVILLTETNVPHDENISYFGKGDEAHMVYNFSLPPLLLHALLRGDSTHLSNWADTLGDTPKGTSFFNFTASHDGVGVRPLQGILADEELHWLAEQVRERGGKVSMKANSDGSQSPYELNVTYRSALSEPGNDALSEKRFLCSQAVSLAFRGMPAVYFHSLMGTPNNIKGMEETGQNRTINRLKYERADLEALLADSSTPEHRIFGAYQKMLKRRQNHPAFHPNAPMEVLEIGSEVFAFIRRSLDGKETIICVFNMTADELTMKQADVAPELAESKSCRDILSGEKILKGKAKTLTMAPYQAMWLSVK